MRDMFRLDGQVAVVIGGAGGIGEACAAALASRGAKLVIAGRTLSKLADAAKKIESETGSQAIQLQVDVTSDDDVKKLADEVVARMGTVDILVNAHGVTKKSPATDINPADWDWIFATNVKGTALACKHFGRIMVDKKKGKIINLSSIRGVRGTDGGNMPYGATKGAVDMITRMLAIEWAPYNINVNAIGPSVILTDLTRKTIPEERQKILRATVPLGRFGELDDVIGACVYLASPESDFVTGQILYIDGGLTAKG
jgi:NAD(P)-dependent dehydrogenase (short-subunit alcohol dehydrogenase family)